MLENTSSGCLCHMRRTMGYRIFVVRRSDGDIAFRSLCHYCIHSHMKTYPDKAVEIGKTAWPSRGQAPGKTVISGPTTCTSRTGRPGLRPWHEDSGEHRGPTGLENVATRSRRKTQGSPARPKDEEDKRRRRGGQEDDKKRTKGGRRVGQHSQTTSSGQKDFFWRIFPFSDP